MSTVAAYRVGRRRQRVSAPLTAVIVLGGFMSGLDTSLVNVGLTIIAHDLRSEITSVQWITSGYRPAVIRPS